MISRCALLILFVSFHLQLFGQLMLDDINLGQIEHRKIRRYIECQVEEGKRQFCDIRSTWKGEKDLSAYQNKKMTFFLNGSVKEIWQGYVSANPSESWNGQRISFALLLQKSPISIYYNRDSISGIDTGQVYFLNLKLLLGLCNIPVAFEIVKVDHEEKVIEFSYIEGNKSQGIQRIKFIDIGDNQVKINHTSYFKSDSQLRDKVLYPFFHKKIVNGFHRNMRKLLLINSSIKS